MIRWIDIAIYSVLFISGIVFFRQPFEFYISYVPVLAFLPFFMARYPFPKQLLYLLLPLLIFGVLGVYFNDNTMAEFLKIFINVVISVLFFYYVFLYYNKDIHRIFEIYMKICVVVSIIGLIQLASYWVGFKPGYDFRMYGFNKWGFSTGGLGLRINSVFSEPSYFGATIGPAFFVAMINVLFRKTYFLSFQKSLIIIIAYILTFSTVAYLGIFLVMILLVLNFGLVRYIALAIPIGIIVFNLMYNNAEEFKVRVDGLKALYVDNILEKEGLKEGESNLYKLRKLLTKVHGSSFVQYNNYVVATKNMIDHPFFGTGLGSHKVAFERYNVLDKLGGIYKFNTADANSMFLRLMSETGLFGVLFIILFIWRFYIRMPADMDSNIYWLVSNASLVMIILQLVRQGNYTYNGFFFYMWLYYFAFLQWQEDDTDSVKPENPPPPDSLMKTIS